MSDAVRGLLGGLNDGMAIGALLVGAGGVFWVLAQLSTMRAEERERRAEDAQALAFRKKFYPELFRNLPVPASTWKRP